MKKPIIHVLGFTKLHLRAFGRAPSVGGFNLDRTLADFSFMPVLTKHIFHESSDIACHVNLLTEPGAVFPPGLDPRLVHTDFSFLTHIKQGLRNSLSRYVLRVVHASHAATSTSAKASVR